MTMTFSVSSVKSSRFPYGFASIKLAGRPLRHFQKQLEDSPDPGVQEEGIYLDSE